MKNSPETLKKRNQLKKEWFRKLRNTNFPKFVLKRCKDCEKIRKCQWNSSFTQTGKPEYKARCVKCHKTWLNKLRRGDRAKKLRNIRRKKALLKIKQWAVNYLGGECQKCGYSKCLSALTFHHKDPKEKEHTVGQILDYPQKTLIKELKKCDLLCFNCHMELHEKLNNKTKK